MPPDSQLSESATMRAFITLIETQYNISFPSMPLEESTEIDLCPPLRRIIKLILKIVEEYTEYGSAGASLLKRWLGLTGPIHHNATDLVAMLNDAKILKHLYRRGIADLYPPRLSLHQAFDGLVIISPTTTVTDVPICGEEKFF
ncbi:ATPase [Corchorus capsularis]|uniref:ATPase n=1 Tax=Corchorus capsularis TaxID=210143 RepID=A0A1R3H933_COCAP|nr:ATPase [Corchorus capsularis]